MLNYSLISSIFFAAQTRSKIIQNKNQHRNVEEYEEEASTPLTLKAIIENIGIILSLR